MEGDGEGLVAIVQGLDPDGVTLTVCNRSRHNSDRSRPSRARIQINAVNTRRDIPATDQRAHTLPANAATLANLRSSAETSTATDFSRQHTSSQICDGRYASSYKLAHCMVTPTSPPVAVSEFPPQRREPCRNQGNFEIGGHGSGQGSGHTNGKVRVSSSRVRHYGGSQTCVEKGSSHRYCKSNRESEAFAHSLRKYPSMAPFRTASTDLIEKLIRYTQAKNFEEMSRSTKSMRSLRQQKSSDTYEMAKACKHQQTYTRRQDDNDVSNVQVGYRGRGRNFKLYSPKSDSRNLVENRDRETTYRSSYDYLKAANSPYRRSNRSDESPSPVGSSPERARSPEKSRSPEGCKSPERCRSPEVPRSPIRFKSTDGFRSPSRPNRLERPIPFERSVRDLSLSDMSKYIRSTIRQMCNERPLVFQVCPELKNRFKQHKKVCTTKNDRAIDIMEDEPEEDQASGSVLSRLFKSFSRCVVPSTDQAGCQCTRTDCYCTQATQCVNNPDASTNTAACSCKTPTKTGCCRGMSCVCANKAQDQAYYNKRIDEEISEWLKDVPVHSIEGSDSKTKRETLIKKLKKMLKTLPDDENFDDNARNEIKSFVDDFPLWNPGKDMEAENLFKNQLTDKLTEKILSVPKKPDRFRDIVKKWIVNMDFEDNGKEVDKETIIGNFVSALKSLAADRPACDVKYTHTLRKEIIELLVELALKFDGDMVMLKKMANKLATEIVSLPRNVNLSGDTTDLTDEFEENVSDWICEHGFCAEFKKDPKLIESLSKKLNKLKSQGIDDECVVEKMKEEIHQFVDDVGIAIETMDELIDELMKQLSNTVQTDEMERLNQDELTEVLTDWLHNLPGTSDLHPQKFEKIIKELVKLIIERREQGNEVMINDILNFLVDADVSIDSADLGIHVEELREKLNILPSNKYHKEQVKKVMMQDIFDVIESMPVPQDKKAELRNKAHEIVENHLNKSSLNSKEDHDDVKDAILDDMDDVISSIDIPKESRLKLKTSLSNVFNKNFDKSFTSLSRLNRDESNLKQTIAKEVRNAVKELPIDTDKMKIMMDQVKGTLSKNMHKPLPSNVKITVNEEISDTVERCPISEDNSIVSSLKKMLSTVASKHLNVCLPKCVCDIQRKVEKDVGIVIDRSSIGTSEKKELKKIIQDILTENEDRHISDEVLRTIKKDISGVVSDLSIPQHKKNVLKKTVDETISKDFNEALPNLRHDLNKIRNKLFEDIYNVAENSQIPRDVKTHLINKLKSVLARNLDSSLSDEEKYIIIMDVSNIVKDDMPEEKRRSLTNKLAKTLDTQQRKEDTNEIEQYTKNLKELEIRMLEHILREMVQAIEEAPIPIERKIELKKKMKDMASIDYKKPATDIAEALTDGINEILDELHLPKDKKNVLKNELTAAIDEYTILLRKIKDVETKYLQTKRRSNANVISKHKKNGKGLMPIKEFEENKEKESILQGIEHIIEESAIPEDKKMEMKKKLKNMASDNLKKPFSDDVQDTIKIGIIDVLNELQILESEKNTLKRALVNMVDKNLDNVRDFDTAKVKESKATEKMVKESAIPEGKKMDLKRKLKIMATDNLEMPFSGEVVESLKIGKTGIQDEQQIPESEKNTLKRALINIADKKFDNLWEVKHLVEKVDEKKAKGNILQGIEDIIEESAIPEEKKMILERKLKNITADNLKKSFNDNVQDIIKIGIVDILDELQIPKSDKDKLKRELTKMTDNYLDNLRKSKQPVENFDEKKAKGNTLQGIEKIIEESAIPEEKKMKLKRKLKKMAADNLKKPFSDDVQDTIKIGIVDILDELQLPKSEKDQLKRALINMADDNLDNLRDINKVEENILHGTEKITKESAIPEDKKIELKRKFIKMTTDHLKKPFSDDMQDGIEIGIADTLDELQIPKTEKDQFKRTLKNMADDHLDNLRDDDKTDAKKSILQGMENTIEESAIPEEKKMELKRKLKKMATDNLNKPFSGDVQDAIKIGITDILDELRIPKSEKDTLKHALINMADENLDNLRKSKQPVKKVDERKARENILQGIEKIIEESAMPEEKNMELKRKLKKIATDNFKKPFSNDVLGAIKISIIDILDELQIPKSEKEKLKRKLITMADKNLDNLRETKQDRPLKGHKTKAKESILQEIEKINEESAIPGEKNMIPFKLTKTQRNMLFGLDSAIDEAFLPMEKKKELKKILITNMGAKNLQISSSDDFEKTLKDGIYEIISELNSPKDTKSPYAKTKSDASTIQVKTLKVLIPIEEVDETNAKESILQGIEKIIEESAIPEIKKMELKGKLNKNIADNLKKPFTDDVHDVIRIGIVDILDELQIPYSEKNKLKRVLLNMVDKNVDNLRAFAPKLLSQVDDFIELDSETQNIILLRFEKAINEVPIPTEKKKELKKKLKEVATKNVQKSLFDDTAESLKDGIHEILDELNLQNYKKNKLKNQLTTAIDDSWSNLQKSMPDTKRNKLNIIIHRVLPQFDEAANPIYQKQLAEEFDELLEIALRDGDFKDARRKLTKKLMRERNLSEKKAGASVDELIGRAREIALKEDMGDERYELDPSYVKTLEADINELVNLALFGGDFEDARRKLVRKIMREQNLAKEKASGFADELIGKAKKLALGAQSKDKSLFHKESFAKAISNAVDQSTMSKSYKSSFKNNLLSKLKLTMDKKPFINKDDLEPLKYEVLKDLKKILDSSSMPKDKKNELNWLLNEELTKAIDEIMDTYDDEEGYTKTHTKAISKAVDKSPMPNLEKMFLKKELVKTFEGVMDDYKSKVIKHTEAFTKAISDAVGRCILSESDKSSTKNKLLNKIKQTVEESPHIYDTGALKAEVLKDCENLVNASLIPIGKKGELKLLLKEEIMEDYDEDKIEKHKEAFIKAINDAVDQSTLSKSDKSSLKNKLLNKMKQTIDKSPHINDTAALKAEVLKDCTNLIDASSIPIGKKNELKLLLKEEIMDDYNEEETFAMKESPEYEDGISKYKEEFAKAVKKSPIPKPLDEIMDDDDEDKVEKHKELFIKAINDATDQSTLSKSDKISLKNKLLNKMKQTVDESPHINDTGALRAEILKDCENLVDASSIPIGKKDELKFLLKEEIMGDYIEEETFAMKESPEYEDGISKYKEEFAKAVKKSPIPKPLDEIMDDYDEDKIEKYKKAFIKAINDATDQSTLSKSDKISLKNKLLNKMKQTVDESPYINDTRALTIEVLKDCKNLVNASSIPIGKKTELKFLLKENIMRYYDKEETSAMEESSEYEDDILKHKEEFAKAINEAVKKSPIPKPLYEIMDDSDESPMKTISKKYKEPLDEIMDDYDESPMEAKLKKYTEPLDEIMDDYDAKFKKYKEAFSRAINYAVNQSTLSKPDKSSQKNQLLSELNQTIHNSPHLNDIGALTAEVLKDSKKVVDVSSIPTDKKNELKLLLQEAMTVTSKELMDDEKVSRKAFAMYKDKLTETVKTWMDSLPIDLDPKVSTALAKDLASDILDRQKYLQVHSKAISTDKDEIENLKYQIFRRIKNLVDPKDIPPIMKGTEELYRMIMEIEPPPGFLKLRREQSFPERRRRDPVPQDRKNSTSTALLNSNINYSLKELIATSKSVRRQWSRNLEAISKLTISKNENNIMKEKLAIYDATGQINMLSTKSRAKKETSTFQGTKSKKHVAPKQAHVPPKQAHVPPKPQKNNKEKPSSRLSKLEKALTFNNTTKQKSPFTPNSNQGVDEKDFTKFANDTIKAWLEKIRVNIEPDAKNRIIEGLTRDVVDRKKYLQVFGSSEPSQSDELEYLKLQVHRRLSEFVSTEEMKRVIVDTKQLLAKIDTIKMKVIPENSKSQKSNIRAKATNTSMNGDEEEIEQELSNMDFIPGQTSTPKKPKEKNKEPAAEKYKTDVTESTAEEYKTKVGEPTAEKYKTKVAEPTAEEYKTKVAEHVAEEYKAKVAEPTAEEYKTKFAEPTAEEYKTKVTESINTWIESMPIDLKPEAKTDFIDELANDVVDRKKYLQVQPDKAISKKEEIENLRFQVFKRLTKADPDACVTPDIEKIEELYKMIGDGRRKSLTPKQAEEFKIALNEVISATLDDYNIRCNRRVLHSTLANVLTKLGQSNADQDEIVENLIEAIKGLTFLSVCVCDEEAEELAHKLLYRTKKLIARIQETDRQKAAITPVKKKDFKDAIMKDIGDVFSACPMSEEKRRLMESQLAEEYAKDLGIPLEESDVMDGTGPEPKKGRYGMSFNGLTNFIDTWLSSIHTDDDTKGEEMKKDAAYNLIHKIGEMNVDPEIFNDDSLYEAVLRDELQNLLGDITISDDEIKALKEDLIEKVLEAQHRAHDEIAGQTYKRNLRNTISKLLPDQRNLSKEEQATIETLKDQLADAYIDLHFSGGNENQRELLKIKITDEINKFCRDYLYRNPSSPLNSQTLNNNLYTALNEVPLPTGDSIRYEVEQARIREKINDWIKELPLSSQNPTELLARNKLVYMLSKKLFDIEVEGDDTDNELMKKAIVNFLNKMPLESGENNDTLADKLIDKLKASEESRKYDASSNVTIDAFGNVSAISRGSGMDSSICPAYKALATPGSSGSPKVYRRPYPKQPKPFPPCTLSPEDIAHLERIKRRTCLSPSCLNSLMRNNKRGTGVGPRPVDAESQIMLRPFGMEKRQSPICPVDDEKTPRPCPGLPPNLVYPPRSHARKDPFEIEKPPQSPICSASCEKTSRPCQAGPSRLSPQSSHQVRRHTISSSNIEEVEPQIIIKQYYLNPNEKNSTVESDLQQSGRRSRRKSDLAPCHQPGPAPCQQTGSAPCDQTRTSSYAQSTPAPYHRPSLGTLQQQNPSQQRIPCDQFFSCPQSKSQHQPSPERYSSWDPQQSFQRPSQRDTPSSRSSCTPSPCMSPLGLNQQSSLPRSPGISKRDYECQMPKRDGLQDQSFPSCRRPCRKDRVMELGSSDDLPNARPKKRHSDQSDWPYTKFQEDDNFWGAPMRRVILDEEIDESIVMEREQREERIRCRCKERLIPKCGRCQPRTCPRQEIRQGNEDGQNLKRCSKCYGRHCPFPSFLYFRE